MGLWQAWETLSGPQQALLACCGLLSSMPCQLCLQCVCNFGFWGKGRLMVNRSALF